jgi:hypothetical protein
MITINGKEYPLWSQFVERKKEWIGCLLEDQGDSMDRAMGIKSGVTKITDIQLNPNGEDSAFFLIVGEDFSCGFDVKYGGVTILEVLKLGQEGYINFSGCSGHTFRFKTESKRADDREELSNED